MRAPLLPVGDFLNRPLNDETLKTYFSKPEVGEALLLSSPNLYEEWQRWQEGDIDDDDRVDSLKVSLSKYLLRMSSRCTPFGMAAGFCLADWAKDQDFELESPERYKRYTRLDMFLTIQIAKKLLAHEDLRNRLRYYPNSSLYEHNSAVRYIERIGVGIGFRYEISQVEANEYLSLILEKAREGKPKAYLADLITDEDISREEADEFLEYLIDSQLLISELEPNLTGPDYFDQIVDRLEALSAGDDSTYIHDSLNTLHGIGAILQKLDNVGAAESPALYDELVEALKAFEIEAHRKFLVRVDMQKVPRVRKMSFKHAAEIRKALKALNTLSAPNMNIGALRQFKERFKERYGNKEVPVLQALDNESGLGYLPADHTSDPSPLVDDVPVNGNHTGNVESQDLDPLVKFLTARHLEALMENKYEVALKPEDIAHLQNDWDSFHDSLIVMGSLLPENKVFIRTVAGHGSAAGMLARFSNADEELNNYLLDIMAHETKRQPEGKLLAEIVHLPQSRYGNVLTRTALRPYEIPFLARAVSDPEHTIFLDDLTIQMNARNEMILRSKRLNKQIIPRLASAHNYGLDSSLPVYHFLAELQGQDKKKGMFFRWPITIEHPFKPRVSVGKAILARASWTFRTADLAALFGKGDIDLKKVQQWRDQWRIPSRVLVAESDREMLINLDDPTHLAIFKDFVRKLHTVHLVEFLFEGEDAVIRDVEGKPYTNEFCATFLKTEDDKWEKISRENPLPLRPEQNTDVQDTFVLGSEWLYYKLYLGMKSCDEFLAHHLPPLLHSLKADGLIDYWFFIRYNDPKYHIRLRFHLTDTKHVGEVVNRLYTLLEPLRQSAFLYDVVNDMYEREIERYGARTMVDCEKIFGIHSESIVAFLAYREQSEHTELLNLLFGMRAFDQLFELLGMTLEDKLGFTERSFNDFCNEFGANRHTKGSLSGKYRFFAEYLEEGMSTVANPPSKLPEEWMEVEGMLKKMKSAQKAIVGHFKTIIDRSELEPRPYGFIWSINHMFANRLFTSKQRKHEFLLYAQLSRYYKIQTKRKK